MMPLMMLILMLAMIAAAYVPKPWDAVVAFGTYIVLLAYMYISEKVIQYIIAAWPALDAVIVGDDTRLAVEKQTFLIVGEETATQQVGEQTYMTRIRLAYPYRDPEGGRTRDIYIYHFGEWRQRISFKPGRIRWRGTTLQHPQVEHVILARDPVGLPYRAKLYPVFHLVSSGHDALQYINQYSRVMQVVRRHSSSD
jgi:hypothetical protein